MNSQLISSTPVFGEYTSSLRTYALIIYIVMSSISFIVFNIGLLILYKRPQMGKNTMFCVLLVIQIMITLHFVIRIIVTRANVSNETLCRVLIFFNNGIAEFVIYLCVYIIIYLQLTIIHKVSPYKKWPQAVLLVACVLCSIGPNMVILIISRKNAGVESFCTLPFTPSSRLLWVLTGTVIIWVFVAGIVCMASMVVITMHIIRTSRKIRRFTDSGDGAYGTGGQQHIYTTATLLNRTLRTVVWFPITPILSLWLNCALIIIRHYTQSPYVTLEYINISLFSLMTLFMALAFFLNPLVLDFLRSKESWRLTHGKHGQDGLHRSSVALEINVQPVFSTHSTVQTASTDNVKYMSGPQ